MAPDRPAVLPRPSEEPVVSFETVSLSYGRTAVLRSVTFTLRPGEKLLLLGANGAGKSTVLRLAMGLGYPDSGSILVYGEPPGSRKRGMIGYLSGQFEPPYDWWTVREAVDHHGRYFATWDSRLAWDLLDRLEVNPGIRLGTLSSGERRRVQLVLALSARSQFLVLDEPLARIDQSGFRLVSTLIGAHIHEHPGTTVLMATHDTEPFLDLNPATLLLQDGIAEQVGDGPPPKTDG